MPAQLPPVTIPHTEVRNIASACVNQTYRIFVALPPRYAEADKVYAVLYTLDANGSFAMVREIANALLLGPEIPELLIVGIGYPVDTYLETMALRNRDFTPTEDAQPYEGLRATRAGVLPYAGSGGAAAFLRFVSSELMPLVQTDYRADPDDSALFGYSLGGLFALYSLFHQPKSFRRYIIGSPSIWWDHGAVFAYEREFAARHADLTARIFMSAGELEESESSTRRMMSNVQQLSRTLQERQYASLALKTIIFEGETHLSGLAAMLSRGLRTIYDRPVSASGA